MNIKKIMYIVLFFVLLEGKTLEISSGESRVSLLELYTSQGCSSCPSADKWLGVFKDDPRIFKDIIPIAFHVNYWDYIGWPDIFALSTNSVRQYRYRELGDIKAVYTPEFILNGKEYRKSWFKNDTLIFDDKVGVLNLSFEKGILKASYLGRKRDLIFNIGILGFGLQSEIGAGENIGKVLNHDFVLLSHQVLKSSTNTISTKLLNFETHDAKRFALVVWINDIKNLTPIQAVGDWIDIKGIIK